MGDFCTMGVGCDEYGACFASAHGRPNLCPRDEYPGQAPCPHCFESSGYMARHHPATWYEPAWEDSDPTRPCSYCNSTGTVDSPLVTMEDLEDLAADEDASRAQEGGGDGK